MLDFMLYQQASIHTTKLDGDLTMQKTSRQKPNYFWNKVQYLETIDLS